LLRRRNDFQERYTAFLHGLRNEIVNGELKPGEYILPENTLSEKYGLSRVSIRKALAELVEEGLIEKIAGKGNRVKFPESERTYETVRLAWFSTSYEIEIVRKIIARFEEKHPFIRIELTLLPEIEYALNLSRQMEAGHGPDLFIISDHHFREFVDLDQLELLEGYLPAGIDPERDSYRPVFDMFTHEGRLVAAPFLFSPVVVCYNRTIFREAGVDWDNPIHDWNGLLDVAKRCTRDVNGDGMIDQYGFCFSASLNRWPVFVLQNKGAFFREGGGSCFSEAANIEALEFCVDLMYKHEVSPIFSHGATHLAESLFMKQRAAMILTTYYFMNEFRDHPIEWDVLPVPRQKEIGTLLLGGGLAISRTSGKAELARKVVDFMLSEEAQTLIKRHGCTIPMLKRVAEDEALLNPDIHPPHYQRFSEVMPYAHTLHGLGLRHKDITMLRDELNLLWANMETPKEACERIDNLLNGQTGRLEKGNAM
jgi:multiple sugar transport system substrate-binding protein